MKSWLHTFTLLLAVLVAGCSHQAHTQNNWQERYYSDAELDQMLAPIALYPDVVLSQVLMAATFPDQLDAAAAWVRDNPGLEGTAAVNAAAVYPWDPSVQALVAFPDLVRRLAEDADWTWRLGDAYLAQEGDVIDAIQRLRDHAYRSRHLESLDHLHVYHDRDVIIIEPINPHRIYLPWYRPQVVYGSWWRPHHPPHYWDSPRYNSGLGFYWGNGVALGAGFFYSSFHWHNRHIIVFDRHHYRPRADHHYYKHYQNPRRWDHHNRHRNPARYQRDYDGPRERYGRVYGRGGDGRRHDDSYRRPREGYGPRGDQYPQRDHRAGDNRGGRASPPVTDQGRQEPRGDPRGDPRAAGAYRGGNGGVQHAPQPSRESGGPRGNQNPPRELRTSGDRPGHSAGGFPRGGGGGGGESGWNPRDLRQQDGYRGRDANAQSRPGAESRSERRSAPVVEPRRQQPSGDPRAAAAYRGGNGGIQRAPQPVRALERAESPRASRSEYNHSGGGPQRHAERPTGGERRAAAGPQSQRHQGGERGGGGGRSEGR